MYQKRALSFVISAVIAVLAGPSLHASQFNLTIQQYGEFYYYEGAGPGDPSGYASQVSQLTSGTHTINGGSFISDYFVLDLSSIAPDQTITSVSYSASNPAFFSEFGNGPFTVSFWLGETSAAATDLENPTSSNTAALYEDLNGANLTVDLGVTPDYTFQDTPPSNATSISLQGNSTFVDLLNENRGGLLVIAGNLNGGGGGVSISPTSPVFTVTTVPEPGSWESLSAGAALCALALGRRSIKRT